jgi:cation transport ATPase
MISAVAGGRAKANPSATAVSSLQLATLGGAGLLTWLQLGPSGHPALLPTIATLVGGASIWKEATSELAARRIGIHAAIAVAVASELALGEFSSALITTLVVRCTSVLEGWAIARVETLERGCLVRAPIERLANHLSSVLVWCGLTAAAVTFLATGDPRAAVAVILVTTGGTAVSTRLALLTAVGRSLVGGAIVKGGVFLEALWACDTAVVASSALLILDEPVVRAVYPAAGVSVHDVLTAAATAERPSSHPIGRAIVRSAVEKRLTIGEPDRFSCVQGCGIKASCAGEEILVGNTAFVTQGRLPDVAGDAPSSTVFVMRGGQYLGAIALVRQPRPNARRAIAELRTLAVRTHFLTGDSGTVTEPLARELMVDHFEPDLGPAERLQRVQDLTAKRRVVMLGDAVEDAPALEAATVGITVGSAASSLDQSADVMLLGNDVAPLVEVMRLARRTRRVILGNITGMLLVEVTGVALAAAGVLSPVAAVLVRAGAAVVFLLNASRLGLGAASAVAVHAPFKASAGLEP